MPNHTQLVPRKYLSPAEVAQLWGVDRKTVLRAIADGRLPAMRLSRKVLRVRVEDADALGTPVRSARSA